MIAIRSGAVILLLARRSYGGRWIVCKSQPTERLDNRMDRHHRKVCVRFEFLGAPAIDSCLTLFKH